MSSAVTDNCIYSSSLLVFSCKACLQLISIAQHHADDASLLTCASSGAITILWGSVAAYTDAANEPLLPVNVLAGLRSMGRKLAQRLSMGKKEPEKKSVKISQQEPEVHDLSADASRVSFAPAPPAVIQVEASAASEASSFGDRK